ncbi:MAG: phosphatase PAP2-related protein [Candidatus Taylorbacteria bacterium]
MKSFTVSLIFFIASLVVYYFAGKYATLKQSNYVTDIVLSNIRVYDVDFIFVYGAFAFSFFVALLCFYEPKKIPFTLKTIALFVIIRSVFISLTHIAPFPSQIAIDPNTFMSYFFVGGDLFFSGHTGLPFLLALIYWKNIRLRILFIALSLTFGAVVLMGHIHYSIDVLSAFFISYGIYRLSEIFFKNDHARYHT